MKTTTATVLDRDTIRQTGRERYGQVARNDGSGCGCGPACCGDRSLLGAKSRVQRGRQQLKKMLLECCQFEFDRRGHAFGCEPRRAEACPECGAS